MIRIILLLKLDQKNTLQNADSLIFRMAFNEYSVPGYTEVSHFLTLSGETTPIASDGIIDLSLQAPVEINISTKYSKFDDVLNGPSPDNFIVVSQKWTITLFDGWNTAE